MSVGPLGSIRTSRSGCRGTPLHATLAGVLLFSEGITVRGATEVECLVPQASLPDLKALAVLGRTTVTERPDIVGVRMNVGELLLREITTVRGTPVAGIPPRFHVA